MKADSGFALVSLCNISNLQSDWVTQGPTLSWAYQHNLLR